jgi:hypothetical protein
VLLTLCILAWGGEIQRQERRDGWAAERASVHARITEDHDLDLSRLEPSK